MKDIIHEAVKDILWKAMDCERDDSLPVTMVAAKAANAIYWRDVEIKKLRDERDELQKQMDTMPWTY